METIQELEVWYIIPSIRKELTTALKEKGLKQVEIAERLGVTKAAINQYLSKKRGNEIKFNETLKNEVRQAASRINTRFDTIKEIQNLIELTRKERIVCQVHKMLDKEFNKCDVCFEKQIINVGK